MATIAVVMMDGVADWEIGVVLPAAREWLGDTVTVASIDGRPVTSIGGLPIVPTLALADLAPLEADLWILPGSERWQHGEVPGLSDLLVARLRAGRPVAAICGATLALAWAGLLDDRPHTSNSLAFLQERCASYGGTEHYRDKPVVSADGLVSAPGASPVGFACECLALLHPDKPEAITQIRQAFAREFG